MTLPPQAKRQQNGSATIRKPTSLAQWNVWAGPERKLLLLGSSARRRILSKLAVGACSILLLGSGSVAAADSGNGNGTPGWDYAPSSRPAAGPEALTKADNNRPVSGKNLEAGPPSTKDSAGVWQVDRTTVTLRNTVTDADGDAANLTFQVYTTDAAGNPKDQVKLTILTPANPPRTV
jgi:hypothetical protein